MQIRTALFVAGLAGCSLYSSEGDAPARDVETRRFPPGPINRTLDLLFVVDNSGSMAEEQSSLAQRLIGFVDALATIEGGLPSLHAGIVSTNMGSGGVSIGGCSTTMRPQGDAGRLLTNGCPGVTVPFLSDIVRPDGSRERNFAGDLAANLGCMAQLGTGGCGFEQPLEAMRTALLPDRNPGFRRPGARLAIVFVTDEDDCSALPGGALFGEPSATVESPLGPRTSFRCFEFGVACDGDADPRQPGARTGCEPREDSAFVQPVSDYVAALHQLAPEVPITIAATFGPVGADRSATVMGDPDDPTRPALAPSCESSLGIAFPAFRLQSFVDAFADQPDPASICDPQADALMTLASELREDMRVPCFAQRVVDHDAAAPGVQAACEVTEFRELGGFRFDVVDVPACDGAGPGPCWRVVEDLAACPADSTAGTTLRIEGRNAPADLDVQLEASCVVART